MSVSLSCSSILVLISAVLGPIVRRALARKISIKTMSHIKCPYKGLLYEFARDLSGRSAYNMHLLRPSNELRPVVRSNSYSRVTFLSNIRLNSLTFYCPSLDFPVTESATPPTGHNRHRFSRRMILRAEFQGIYKNAATGAASANGRTSL